MKLSIRIRLILYMTVSSVLFAILLFGFNQFFAEKYYLYNKKHTLIETSQKLTELIGERNTQEELQDTQLLYQIKTLEKSIGGTIIIGAGNGEIYYPSETEHGLPVVGGKFPFDFMDGINKRPKEWERYSENAYFLVRTDPHYEIETLRFQVQMENGLKHLIWVPMEGIAETAALSNRVTAVLGLITILLTGACALIFSRRFTKPITEINKTARQMADLDFSQTLAISSSDELGELSYSINRLSYSLNQAITELNERNRQLEHDILYERSLDKMRKEFVSNVSHELKTPIFLIQGYAEGLKTNVATSNERKEFYCNVIMEESDKMNRLVRDLLDLSQLEAGFFTIQKEQINATFLVDSIIEKYQKRLKDLGVHLTKKMEENIFIEADAMRLEQVIANFLNNALTHLDEKKELRITLKKSGQRACFGIINSGRPIPEEEMEKIWTSFYKIDPARTREDGGSGLGLSIVKSILDAHDSKYGVNNREDGVEFWFEMSRKESD